MDDEHLPLLDDSLDTPLDPESKERARAEHELVKRLDWRLMPTVFLIFIMNYIDRNAMTSVRPGLQHDLGLSDVQYATALAILFVSYSPFQIPSNMIINYVSRPSIYIGFCVIFWGLTSALTGATHDYSGILICRILIGLPEAAFYPGASFLLSRWYTREELAFRSAIMFSALLLSMAFGNLFAAWVVSTMEGVLGIRAWRWLFYIEGGGTMLVGVLSMFLLPDFPHNTRWITGSQRRLAQIRLAEETGEADIDGRSDSVFLGVKLALQEPKVWLFTLMITAEIFGLSAINYFPTITSTLGFSPTKTLLLSAPPWLVAAVICLINARHADKTGERYFHLASWWWIVILGFIISQLVTYTPLRYFSLFLMACGHVGLSLTVAWAANAIPRPPAKRAAAIGIINGVGNIGNIFGAYIWKSSWGPSYLPSMIICTGALLIATFSGLAMRQILIRENKELAEQDIGNLSHANRERIKEAARLEGISFEEALARQKGFRYQY